MYIAKIDIGEYKKGETVPKEIAVVWESMYLESPVELKTTAVKETVKSEPKEEKPYDMIDDYLGRSQNVVKKNIVSDKLSNEQLKMLLESEKDNRNRQSVIKLLNIQLGDK